MCGMTDLFPAKTVCTQLYFFTSTGLGRIRVMLHLKALLTIINWTTLSNNLSSPPLSESCRQYVPTPPPAQHGMRKRCLDPSSRSHQPLACSHLSGGGRVEGMRWGGSLQMVIWSPTGVDRFVLGKKPKTKQVCALFDCLYSFIPCFKFALFQI